MDLDSFLHNHVRGSTQHRAFYHFTDSRNLNLINSLGLLSMRRLRELHIDVPAPGGNQWSQDADLLKGMDAYVHLCFTEGHPMAHSARVAGTIENVCFLQIRPDVIKLAGVLVTDEVANKAGVIARPADEMLDHLDLPVVYKRMNWKDPAINARLQAADKYEILVPDCVPRDYILL